MELNTKVNILDRFGHASAFSFYPAKILGALGDGGCVTTNDKKIAEFIKSYSNYGSDKKYFYKYKGRNNRLDEMQAGFLRSKVKVFKSRSQNKK